VFAILAFLKLLSKGSLQLFDQGDAASVDVRLCGVQERQQRCSFRLRGVEEGADVAFRNHKAVARRDGEGVTNP